MLILRRIPRSRANKHKSEEMLCCSKTSDQLVSLCVRSDCYNNFFKLAFHICMDSQSRCVFILLFGLKHHKLVKTVCSFPSYSRVPVIVFSVPPSKLKHCRGSSWPWEINMGGLALLWGSPIGAMSPPNPHLKGIPPLFRRNSYIPPGKVFTTISDGILTSAARRTQRRLIPID